MDVLCELANSTSMQILEKVSKCLYLYALDATNHAIIVQTTGALLVRLTTKDGMKLNLITKRLLIRSICLMVSNSKRRRSNVAVIHVKIIFISSFLFYCLLLNHSFQTNPNKITNCFKLYSLLQLYKLHLLNAFVYFDFLNRYGW